MNGRKGLTLIETLVGLFILAVALGALSFMLTASMTRNRSAGLRTQAVQVLNYLGRRVVGADRALLPASGGEKTWDYGALSNAFPDLGGEVNLNRLKARVLNLGAPSWRPAGTSLTQYRIEVCWRQRGHESCVQADTVSAAPSTGGTPPPLPGLN